MSRIESRYSEFIREVTKPKLVVDNKSDRIPRRRSHFAFVWRALSLSEYRN